MKIAYDNIIFSLQKIGGISIYWSELIKRLCAKENLLFFEEDNNNIARKLLSIKTEKESSIPIKILRYLPFLQRLPDGTIFHSSYYRISLQKEVINIVTVHDFTYEYFRKGVAKLVHSLQKRLAIMKSDAIICVSYNTKIDLLKFCPFSCPRRIRVIHNGVDSRFVSLKPSIVYNMLIDSKFSAFVDNVRFVLYIGDRAKYKNFRVVLEVIKKSEDYHLVVVGGKEFSREEKKLMKDAYNRIFHLKGLSVEELNLLYNAAFCLIYPSLYEGFGIPVVEAMKAGCPVIAVRSSSIPEIAGCAALLIDPDNVSANSIIQRIRLLKTPRFWKRIVLMGLKQSEKFSWDKCFEETYEFYQEIYEECVEKRHNSRKEI